MSESKDTVVHRVTLGSGRVVLLREMKIKYNELAMKAVGNQAGDNNNLYAVMAGKELLKILIHSIGDKNGQSLRPVSNKEIEDLDAIFTFGEYTQLQQAVGQIAGGADMGNFQTAIEIIGKT